jgi:hypothetical protein
MPADCADKIDFFIVMQHSLKSVVVKLLALFVPIGAFGFRATRPN